MADITTNTLSEVFASPELVEILSEPCACGAQRVLTPGLNSFICADKCCPFRVASHLFAVAERYNMADELPLVDFEYICQDRYYRSWLDFFMDEWEDSDFEDAYIKLVEEIKADYDISLPWSLSGLDVLSEDQIYTLCGDYQSVTEFVTALETSGVLLVSERLGLTEAHLFPVAVHVFNRLTSCISDVLEAEELFAQG